MENNVGRTLCTVRVLWQVDRGLEKVRGMGDPACVLFLPFRPRTPGEPKRIGVELGSLWGRFRVAFLDTDYPKPFPFNYLPSPPP